MVLNTISSLVLVGLIGLIKGRLRLDRWLSWGMMIAVLYVFMHYMQSVNSNTIETFRLLWSNSKLGPITIDFFPTKIANQIIYPLFIVLIISIMNNNIFRYEERRSVYNSIVILNFVSICLLICSQNYVQLITAVFVSDILGYLILKDVDSSRSYVIYNFFADMCIFMILSLICGRIQSLDINHLLNYNEIGRHKDFVSLILSLALFIKIGCIPFHSYLLELSNVRFQRMSIINLQFSPLVGLLFLVKLNNIFTISDMFVPIYKTISFITFFVGIILFILKNNFCNKIIYFNMSMFSLIMVNLIYNNFIWETSASIIYIIAFFYNLLFFTLYLYQNREVNALLMINANEINKVAMFFVLIMFILLSNIFFSTALTINHHHQYLVFYCILTVILSLATVLNLIYKSPNTRRLEYLNSNKLRLLSFVANIVIFLFVSYKFSLYQTNNIIFMMIFLMLISFPNLSILYKAYNSKWLQDVELSKNLYNVIIVNPLMHISRVLWLTIDIAFSKKIIEALIKNLNRISLSIFFKINKRGIYSGFNFICLGVLIFIITFYWSNKK